MTNVNSDVYDVKYRVQLHNLDTANSEIKRLRADLAHARGEIAYLRTQVGLLKLRNKSIVALKDNS